MAVRMRRLPLSLHLGAVLTLLLVAMALLSLLWTPYPAEQVRVLARLKPPSAAHWLGTDHFGRDVLSMIMVGARNSIAVAVGVTGITIFTSMLCGYALSQLDFPGRTALWWLILASFMVPTQTLIINHFVLVANLGLVNTWAGIMLPQLIHPVIIIVYKQFFDQVPRDFREAAVMDNASEFAILFKVYLPMNWGVTTALLIVCFIWTWNAFLWPFLAVTRTEMMTVTVGITQVNDAFGIYYARELTAAVLAGLPVALAYLLFQRRVTEAITLSAGIKG